ncbi:MAG: tetratricopeptide repeat protein [Myxococcota bacterium]
MQVDDKGPMDQFSAHLDRGWDLVTRGDYAGALVSARKSLEIDAESPEAHNLLGFIHAAEGNAEEALEHYKQAIDIDESFIEAMLNAAEVLIHPLHDFGSALEMVEDALDYCDSPDEIADATLLKLDALLHMGERDKATALLNGLPDGPFENPHLDFLIGRTRFELGDLEGAAPRIRRAVEQEPDNADARYYLGLLLEAEGDARGATVAFLQTRDLDAKVPPPPWSLPADQFERKVQAAIHRLPESLGERLDGALVVVVDSPGAEVVADGVDPRVLILLEDLDEGTEDARVRRLFVYQRNAERVTPSIAELEDELVRTLEREVRAAFDPSIADGDADSSDTP